MLFLQKVEKPPTLSYRSKKGYKSEWIRFWQNPKNLIFGTFWALQAHQNFFQKLEPITFLTLWCLTSWKKNQKKLMIWRSCIPEGWKDEQSQIYRTLLSGWVSNLFLYHVDVMDFHLQYGGIFLFDFWLNYMYHKAW